MYFAIALFYISCIGIVAMVLLKRHEVKSGHANIVSRLGRRTDAFFVRIYNVINSGVSRLDKHTFIGMAQWVAYHVLVHVRNVYVEIKHKALVNPHGRKVIDAVRGRGEVRNHGASFYLRRISSDK